MIDRLQALQLIPVVALERAADAEPLADALCAGGLPCAEVTLRTEAALDSLRALSGREEFLLGAGTVHSAEQAAAAVEAGAQFVVTPGFNPRTVKWCQENQVPVFPGIATPTDLELALEHGVQTVKFFPAETLGGVNTLKAFSGPYGQMRFIPTGGIHAGNLADYLALPSVLACGGSWMVKAGDWAATTRLTTEAVGLTQ
jgi:2-dehydro-3-deoxyphosphogluconate aldolase / (4S)-4-hydroxy-2-oxoglutarate aldolase